MSVRKRRVVAVVLAVLLLGFVGLLGAVYAAAKVPLPEDTVNAQATIIEYRDGSELGKFYKENRVDIPLADVPPHVRDAVLAAEDRSFYDHSGISLSGIARAAYQDIRGGGARQGGSTITQQYARNAYLSRERTFARKFREAIIAVKLERKHSKDEILEWYLNTIYFGRGASGIEAASKTYFGVPAKKLTVEQGAVLAALIRSPEGGDPAVNPEVAERRWKAVLDGMVETGKLDRADADRMRFPKIKDRRAEGKAKGGDGPIGYVKEAIKQELLANGFTEKELTTAGLRIRTTLDRHRQAAAVKAVQETLTEPDDPFAALVAVEPGTGRVVAMYGGRDFGGKGEKSFVNYALQRRQPGSAFKPFVLAAALDEGISLRSTFDGRSPQKFGDYEVDNFDNKSFGRVDLVTSTANSINTVYVPLGLKVGVDDVMEMTHRLGVPEDVTTCKDNRDASLFLGTCDQRPVDMAAAFATFAAKGEASGWHLVESVRTPKNKGGKRLYKVKVDKTEAMQEGAAADAIHAMRAVVEQGTARSAQIGRPAAGKTGTTQDNTNAWFSGFVPQLSTTVWMGYEVADDNGSGKRGIPPMRNIHGYGEITGGTLPAKIWHAFMTAALEGVPVEDFPPPVFGGSATGSTASPTASPTSGTPTPSATPTLTAPPTVEPTVVPTFEPTKKPTGKPSESSSSPPPPEESSSPTPEPTADGGGGGGGGEGTGEEGGG